MAIEAGRTLSQRYRLIRPVGQGSQASVWVAEHLALTTHVAVKLIDPELAKKESARERFRREATAAAQLRSAHVVQILDHGIDGDQPFIVMELLDGEDLFERLAHRSRLSLRETSKIVTQVARALSRAHAAGIVHRDLKPENVFLCPNEDDEVVKVLDFGVAKVKDAAKVTMQKTGVGTLIGTPHYMSPEQVKGIGEVDYRADLWALGVIAFQCVTGELPYDSEGVGDLLIKITIGELPIPSKVYPAAHPNFDAWFAKACSRDPAGRFQSAREMALALAGVVGVIDGIAPRAPTIRPPPAALAGLQPLPRGRAMTEALESTDWEEVDAEDEGPARIKAPEPSAPSGPRSSRNPSLRPAPAPAAAADNHESHDIVDFDETIPAHSLHHGAFMAPPSARPESAGPSSARASQAAPPPASSPSRPAGPPSTPASRPQAIIAPVVISAPRSAIAPVSAPEPPPRPAPPSTRHLAPPRPTVAPVVTPLRNGPLLTIPPMEFDGSSRRRRLVRFMLAALVLFAVGITWSVVRSQFVDGPGPAAPSTTTTATVAPPPPPEPPPTVNSASAVDPGKVTHPTKPTPSVHHYAPRPRAPKPTSDGTIVVPDPPADEDSIPAAP